MVEKVISKSDMFVSLKKKKKQQATASQNFKQIG